MSKQFDFSKETERCATIPIDWSRIDNKTLLITGATGMVGKYLIDVLCYRNRAFQTRTRIFAVGRNEDKFKARFSDYELNPWLQFCKADVQEPIHIEEHLDYIIHMASNTHPRLYASDPIGTEMSNIFGTYYLLNLAAKSNGCRFLFTSSGDIYGDNRNGKPLLGEKDCGYIDCNTLRAGYIEGKRASEALCNAFKEEKGVDFVIARLCRIYGPTMQLTDSKAISQFIMNAVKGEDIVLKSQGQQVFSYLYIYDVVTALLTLMTKGESGQAYNIADDGQFLSLRELATMLANLSKKEVKFDVPEEQERKGASSFMDVRLDPSKIKSLGWEPMVNVLDGLKETIEEIKKSKTHTVYK